MIFDAAPRITPLGLFAFILNFYFSCLDASILISLRLYRDCLL